MEADTDLHRSRIEFQDGDPLRLYPFTRVAKTFDSPRLIAIDPRFSFGSPIVASRSIRVDVIANRFRAGEGVAALAEDYELSPEEVEEAVRFDAE